MLGEQLGEPADEPAGRLVAGAGEHRGVGEDLVAGERARLAVLVLELGVEQRGHEVVGGVLGAPFDVVGEHVAAGDLVLLDDHGLAGLGAQVGVGAVAHRFLVLFGDAEQHADDAHRQHRAEFGDDVEAAGADERVEARGAELAHLVLERGHPPRREHPRHQAAVHRVDRRVLEQDHARRQLDVGLDDVEDVAARVGERLPVDERLLDVGVA